MHEAIIVEQTAKTKVWDIFFSPLQEQAGRLRHICLVLRKNSRCSVLDRLGSSAGLFPIQAWD
jgi:hypothetical protein